MPGKPTCSGFPLKMPVFFLLELRHVDKTNQKVDLAVDPHRRADRRISINEPVGQAHRRWKPGHL